MRCAGNGRLGGGGGGGQLRALPKDFWDRLAEFLGASEEVGRWPGPLRAGLVVLTPRPIVLLPLVCCIWAAACRPVVRRWVVGPGADGAEEPGRGADDAASSLALEADRWRARRWPSRRCSAESS